MNTVPTSFPPKNAATRLFDGEELALSQLMGFQEDLVSLRAFERRLLPMVLPGVAICVGAFYFLFTDQVSLLKGILVFVLGWLVCLASAIHARRVNPVSRVSGRPMLRFRRNDGPAGEYRVDPCRPGKQDLLLSRCRYFDLKLLIVALKEVDGRHDR